MLRISLCKLKYLISISFIQDALDPSHSFIFFGSFTM